MSSHNHAILAVVNEKGSKRRLMQLRRSLLQLQIMVDPVIKTFCPEESQNDQPP